MRLLRRLVRNPSTKNSSKRKLGSIANRALAEVENFKTKRDGRRFSLVYNGFVARSYELFVKYNCALFGSEAIPCCCVDENK